MNEIEYQELQDKMDDQIQEAENRGEILKVEDLKDEVVERLELQASTNNEIVPIYRGGELYGFWLMPDNHIEYENDYE